MGFPKVLIELIEEIIARKVGSYYDHRYLYVQLFMSYFGVDIFILVWK